MIKNIKDLLTKYEIKKENIKYMFNNNSVFKIELKDGRKCFISNGKLIILNKENIMYITNEKEVTYSEIEVEEFKNLEKYIYDLLVENKKINIKSGKCTIKKHIENSKDLLSYYFDILENIGIEKNLITNYHINDDYSVDFEYFLKEPDGSNLSEMKGNINFEDVIVMNKFFEGTKDESNHLVIYDIDEQIYFNYVFNSIDDMRNNYNKYILERSKLNINKYSSYIVSQNEKILNYHICDDDLINKCFETLTIYGYNVDELEEYKITKDGLFYFKFNDEVTETTLLKIFGYVKDNFIISGLVDEDNDKLIYNYNISIYDINTFAEKIINYANYIPMEKDLETYAKKTTKELVNLVNPKMTKSNNLMNKRLETLKGLGKDINSLEKYYLNQNNDLYFEFMEEEFCGSKILEFGYVLDNTIIIGNKNENDNTMQYSYTATLINLKTDKETTYEFYNYLPMKKSLDTIYESMYEPEKKDINNAFNEIIIDNTTNDVKKKRLR